MRYAVVWLLTAGLLLEIAAFLIGYVDYIPWLVPHINPAYYRATIGYRKLNSEKVLESDDKGFTEISNLFFDVASKQNPPELLENISITRFVRQGAQLGLSTNRVREKIPVEVQLSNGQVVKWDMNEIKPLIDALKSKNIFKFAAGVFVLGVIIQIIGIIIEIKKSKVA